MEIKRGDFKDAAEKHRLPSTDLRTRAYAVLRQRRRGALVKIEVHVDSDGQKVSVTNLAENKGKIHSRERRKIARFLTDVLGKQG